MVACLAKLALRLNPAGSDVLVVPDARRQHSGKRH
jgi:hypothetical protein